MKFQDKFSSLRPLNNPNTRDKFQIIFFMSYRHVFVKISSEFRGILHVSVTFADLPKFRSSALNIRNPDTMNCVIYIIHLVTIFLQLVAKFEL